MQKVISCKASEVKEKIQPLLDKSWEIVGTTAEVVSVSVASTTVTRELVKRGLIVFVLEKA